MARHRFPSRAIRSIETFCRLRPPTRCIRWKSGDFGPVRESWMSVERRDDQTRDDDNVHSTRYRSRNARIAPAGAGEPNRNAAPEQRLRVLIATSSLFSGYPPPLWQIVVQHVRKPSLHHKAKGARSPNHRRFYAGQVASVRWFPYCSVRRPENTHGTSSRLRDLRPSSSHLDQ